MDMYTFECVPTDPCYHSPCDFVSTRCEPQADGQYICRDICDAQTCDYAVDVCQLDGAGGFICKPICDESSCDMMSEVCEVDGAGDYTCRSICECDETTQDCILDYAGGFYCQERDACLSNPCDNDSSVCQTMDGGYHCVDICNEQTCNYMEENCVLLYDGAGSFECKPICDSHNCDMTSEICEPDGTGNHQCKPICHESSCDMSSEVCELDGTGSFHCKPICDEFTCDMMSETCELDGTGSYQCKPICTDTSCDMMSQSCELDGTGSFYCKDICDETTCDIMSETCVPDGTGSYYCNPICHENACDMMSETCEPDGTGSHYCRPICDNAPCDMMSQTCELDGTGSFYCKDICNENRCDMMSQVCELDHAGGYFCKGLCDEPSPCDSTTQDCVLDPTGSFTCVERDPCISQPCMSDAEICIPDSTTNSYHCRPVCHPAACDPAMQYCVEDDMAWHCEDICRPESCDPVSEHCIVLAGDVQDASGFECRPICDNAGCSDHEICALDGTGGFVCMPMNQCDFNPCDEHHQCIDLGQGNYECELIDACASNPCEEHTVCEHTPGMGGQYMCRPVCYPLACDQATQYCIEDGAGILCEDICVEGMCDSISQYCNILPEGYQERHECVDICQSETCPAGEICALDGTGSYMCMPADPCEYNPCPEYHDCEPLGDGEYTCMPQKGACCTEDAGTCDDGTTEDSCMGYFFGPGSMCAMVGDQCRAAGACCMDESCTDGIGEFYGDKSSCMDFEEQCRASTMESSTTVHSTSTSDYTTSSSTDMSSSTDYTTSSSTDMSSSTDYTTSSSTDMSRSTDYTTSSSIDMSSSTDYTTSSSTDMSNSTDMTTTSSTDTVTSTSEQPSTSETTDPCDQCLEDERCIIDPITGTAQCVPKDRCGCNCQDNSIADDSASVCIDDESGFSDIAGFNTLPTLFDRRRTEEEEPTICIAPHKQNKVYVVCFHGERDHGTVVAKCAYIFDKCKRAYGNNSCVKVNNPSKDQLDRINSRCRKGAVIVVTHSTPTHDTTCPYDVWDSDLTPTDIATIFPDTWVIWNGCFGWGIAAQPNCSNIIPVQGVDGVLPVDNENWIEVMILLEKMANGQPYSQDDVCEALYGHNNDADQRRRAGRGRAYREEIWY
ncbi:hypothetical protein SARC_07486 [Sphaeroforma arctica JP610]|uniref:Uncharacterized protein n=1 Tax=Sphaeroforma arctica JP610 TaxID=667725 RepID=A0A0L0FTM3_9EUKA|nr:hypothetical protein SARC_07486 [Sphaeroforma arctica JP610]KNC80147.1 hypothetical protein SARC_07486 [Sphaeroforma arctica JP610]|eukprot:XP_014154049.1 hypothetical protein SARC_07486 [Sphaeroforma arctica JP610]